MKIVINGKAFAKKYKTGVQRYCIEILKELDEQVKGLDIELVVPIYCKEKIEYKNIKIKRIGKLNLNLWEQIQLPLYAKKNKALIVNLCNTSPIVSPGIVCIHDINCIINKQYYPRLFSFWYNILIKNSIKRAKKIITVSKFSKDEIEKYFSIKNIEIVSNSYEHIFKIPSNNDILKKYPELIKNEYFFTLGTIQKNKNIRWILNVAKEYPEKVFVITGYKNQKDINFDLKNIIYTGYISDEDLKALMENCKAYISPSFYEGFGLPQLEAFALGKNIIASNIPIMKEIFENGCFLYLIS